MSRRLNELPVARAILQQLDQITERDGFIAAVKYLLSKYRVSAEIENLTPETYQILESNPILLICNHPSYLEIPALIATLPSRKDLSIIGNSVFHHDICTALTKTFIPVTMVRVLQVYTVIMMKMTGDRHDISDPLHRLHHAGLPAHSTSSD